ncbi:MAG TPA: MGMT family protein [Acidimicrobiia bacterium]|nr:MGMT family protein [Acidimicrobiia bacterium]
MPDDDFEENVIAMVQDIPFGSVSTYGEIAAEAGHPGAARAVGNLLASTPGLPWWRVVAASGRLVPGAEAEHAQHLRAEGITIERGRVQMGSLR